MVLGLKMDDLLGNASCLTSVELFTTIIATIDKCLFINQLVAAELGSFKKLKSFKFYRRKASSFFCKGWFK